MYLVTGANTGIGFALVRRLCARGVGPICLGCRNPEKAQRAVDALHADFPSAELHVLIVDLSDPSSVRAACEEFKQRFTTLSVLFLNAGIASFTGGKRISAVFTTDVVAVLRDGKGLLAQTTGNKAPSGLGLEFATNVFGPLLLARGLLDVLAHDGGGAVVWTSSRAANDAFFSLDDVQFLHGNADPYGSSKYAADCLAVQMNREWNARGVYTFTTCPGLVQSDMMTDVLPRWMTPLLWVGHKLVPSISSTPDSGAEVLDWIATQPHRQLDTHTKHTFANGRHGTAALLPHTAEHAQPLFAALVQLAAAEE